MSEQAATDWLRRMREKALAPIHDPRQAVAIKPAAPRVIYVHVRRGDEQLANWLTTNTTEEPRAVIGMTELITAFQNHQAAAGLVPHTRNRIGHSLRRLRPSVTKGRRGPDRQWVYVGLQLTTPPPDGDAAAAGPDAAGSLEKH